MSRPALPGIVFPKLASTMAVSGPDRLALLSADVLYYDDVSPAGGESHGVRDTTGCDSVVAAGKVHTMRPVD